MKQLSNIPNVKLGIIAVSRDCFVISLSEKRRAAIVKAFAGKGELYEAKTTVENEKDMLKAVDEVRAAGCNALVVFLGNFGPETPETQISSPRRRRKPPSRFPAARPARPAGCCCSR